MFAEHCKEVDKDISPHDYDFDEKLSFLAVWLEQGPGDNKQFILNFYPCDNTVELIDCQLQKVFLRRTNHLAIELRDLFIGNEVRVYGRQIKLMEYANSKTARFISKSNEHTVVVITPELMGQMGEIIKIIEENQFRISKLRMGKLSRKTAMDFYEYLKAEPYVSSLIENISSGPIVAMEIVGEDAVKRWNKLLSPSYSNETPNCLISKNGLHGSLSDELALKESRFFFCECPFEDNLRLDNATCCVIKPHAVKEGNIGRIITAITNSQFSITAMQMFYLNNTNADDFLEVYKGVVSDYNALLLSILDGPCVALKISSKCGDIDVHGQFRNLCGPVDSSIAKQIRPNTLRAKYGIDKFKNAVHCTDLPEDTVLELEFFFKILNS